MPQTAIPFEFEAYLQAQILAGKAPDMNEIIFAYIPDLELETSIDRNTGLPDIGLWVHQQDLDQVGKLGDNALAYSVVVLGLVPAFTFNAIYLRDKNVANSCGMIVHKADETKENGMSITKTLLQAYTGAAAVAGITVDAETWQIDYQSRLKGIEEDHRLACLDSYGHTVFINGFTVTQEADPDKYKITAGLVYIGGLRTLLNNNVIQAIITKPNAIYLDVVRTGTALSKWDNQLTVVISETELTDYVDGNGAQHFVAKVAQINADGGVSDERIMRVITETSVFQNLLYNTDHTTKPVNQRNFDGNWEALGVGDYGLDGWLKRNQTHKCQIIEEGSYMPNTAYKIQKEGDSVEAISPAGGNWGISVPFSADKLGVSLANVNSIYHFEDESTKLNRCKMHYQTSYEQGTEHGSAAEPGMTVITSDYGASTFNLINFPVEMRSIPLISFPYCNADMDFTTWTISTKGVVGVYGFAFTRSFHWVADATLKLTDIPAENWTDL